MIFVSFRFLSRTSVLATDSAVTPRLRRVATWFNSVLDGYLLLAAFLVFFWGSSLDPLHRCLRRSLGSLFWSLRRLMVNIVALCRAGAFDSVTIFWAFYGLFLLVLGDWGDPNAVSPIFSWSGYEGSLFFVFVQSSSRGILAGQRPA